MNADIEARIKKTVTDLPNILLPNNARRFNFINPKEFSVTTHRPYDQKGLADTTESFRICRLHVIQLANQMRFAPDRALS